MEIIPAIDIIKGHCVRLEQGDYGRHTTYSEKPLSVARMFEQAGLKRLHLVDLDGAKAKHVVNLEVLSSITENTDLQVDFGGGVKTQKDIDAVFAAGAKLVTVGSIAIRDFELTSSWIRNYGPEQVILGADVLDGKIMISGWQEDSGLDIHLFLEKYLEVGVKYILCTDITRDGMLTGPPLDLYRSLLKSFPELSLIASGGVSQKEDLTKLEQLGVYGVVIGKAIYEGKITLDELTEF